MICKEALHSTRMSTKWISVLLLLQLSCYFSSGSCGKVLVWPTEYSHWINIKTILDELVQRGHEVTVLTSSASILVNPNESSAIKYEIFPASILKDDFKNFLSKMLDMWIYNLPRDTFWTYFSQMQEIFWKFSDAIQKLCEDVVLNRKLMTKLQESRFDVILADTIGPGGRPTTLSELRGKAQIWLIRTYWDIEFPRPLLPNVEFVGGLHCKPAKPLPKEMEEFVQSSGENGIVVFTLGSMITNLPEEKANVIASALAQIPQKVLWRFAGKKPDNLGPNTRLYDWIPQNDLLGHPKTKAFVTHGGTNGIYEAIHHGIPMVGIPLFADQHDNLAHMKAKGAAVSLDFHTLSSTDLLNALRMVINNPSYKENAMRLSKIHHDQPIKPLDRAVFWIEFVMRHKGAKHLRPASHDLTWFQYHSLDVIGFLLACVAAAIFVTTRCCLFCYRKFAKTGKKEKKE
ncbi:UDP-glucuronosyltransferase 2B31-like isoform X4 [Neovison vison]|uniref:UDP-glucuronosyltransferase 2B31-like isoform X4 n=1 Tax=Neovison vison TaxID=452646 RepID=UPI001CF014D3|nr:UDP-glucuronosyltransferase 2B31-like isoform X4 [Neogale vison]